MAARCGRSIGVRQCSHSRATLKVYLSALLVVVVVRLQQESATFFCDAYGYADFIAAYNNPAVSYHEVRGNVVLRASLPPLARALTLVGKRVSGGSNRPIIDGAAKYRGIVTESYIKLVNLEFRRFRFVLGANSGSKTIIEKCAFIRNEKGGALSFDSCEYNITKSLFSGNKAVGNGGAIDTCCESSGVIEDTVFENNSATENGGAVRTNPSDSLEINRCRFVNNRAGELGGAAHLIRLFAKVSNSQFIGNRAGTLGGAFRFYANEDEGGLRVCRGNVFRDNRAAGNSTSNNISIVLNVQTAMPIVYFCKPKPPATLIVSTIPNGVIDSCDDC